MKKFLSILFGLTLVALFQGCFFDSYDDTGYGVFYVIIPFFLVTGSVITAISFLFIKSKKGKIISAIICLTPCLVIYIISEIHYFPGYIDYKKWQAKEAQKPKVKNLNTMCSTTVPNFTDDEIILFPWDLGENDFVILKKNDNDDSWNEDYRFKLKTGLLKKIWRLTDPKPVCNSKYLVAYFQDGTLRENCKYYLALFRKNEVWELVDVIENPYSTHDTSIAVYDDFLAVASSIHDKKSVVSIYNLAENRFNLIQTIDIADDSRDIWTYTTRVNFYKDELIISDMDFTNNNAHLWEDDFYGCGKLSFFSFENGKFQETKSITYYEVSFDKTKKYSFVGLGMKINELSDNCLVIQDTSKGKIAIRKINNKWKYDKDLTLDLDNQKLQTEYTIYSDNGIKYSLNNEFYILSYTTFIKNNKNGTVQQIVLNPETNKFYTTSVDVEKAVAEKFESARVIKVK